MQLVPIQTFFLFVNVCDKKKSRFNKDIGSYTHVDIKYRHCLIFFLLFVKIVKDAKIREHVSWHKIPFETTMLEKKEIQVCIALLHFLVAMRAKQSKSCLHCCLFIILVGYRQSCIVKHIYKKKSLNRICLL